MYVVYRSRRIPPSTRACASVVTADTPYRILWFILSRAMAELCLREELEKHRALHKSRADALSPRLQ